MEWKRTQEELNYARKYALTNKFDEKLLELVHKLKLKIIKLESDNRELKRQLKGDK